MLYIGHLDVEKQEVCVWDMSVMLGLKHLMIRKGMDLEVVPKGNCDTGTENFSVFSCCGNEQYICVHILMLRKRLWMLKQNTWLNEKCLLSRRKG